MVVEMFDSRDWDVEGMHGITFDLDTRMLEDDYGVTRAAAYSAIERKLEELGFKHVQYSVYFLPESNNSMEFALLMLKTFATFKFAPAIRDLQGFEVKSWSTLTPDIHESHDEKLAAGTPLWS